MSMQPLDYTAPPIDRAVLDRNIPALRLLGGVFCMGFSAVSTVAGVYLDLAPVGASVPLAVAVGIVLAAIIAVVEVMTVERLPYIYLLALMPDVWYTYQPIAWLVGAIARAKLTSPLLELSVTIVLSLVLSVAISYFGEWMIFGKRRRLEE